MLITHSEETGLIGELWELAALHNNSLRDHDSGGHNPDEDDGLARPLGRALEHERVTDRVPSVLGNTAQGQHGHGHRDGLSGKESAKFQRNYSDKRKRRGEEEGRKTTKCQKNLNWEKEA